MKLMQLQFERNANELQTANYAPQYVTDPQVFKIFC